MNCDDCPFDYDCGHNPDECAITNALDKFLSECENSVTKE